MAGVLEAFVIVSLISFVVAILWVFRYQMTRYQRNAVVLIAIAIIMLVSYLSIAPYYSIVPTGEEVIMPTTVTKTKTLTTVINSTLTTTTVVTEYINATVRSPVYRANPAAMSYLMLIIALVIILVMFAMYFIFRDMMRL